MTTEELCAKWGLTVAEVEALRKEKGGRFITTVRDAAGNIKFHASDGNIVTNEGLDHVLDSTLDGATQITAWKVALVKSTTAPAAGMTYATPTYTEIAASDVSETVRQAWTSTGALNQSIVNQSTALATYTASTAFTAYGAALVGGGTGSTTIANTAGGGTLYSYSKFGSSKAMTNTDTIDITYTFTSADDGV